MSSYSRLAAAAVQASRARSASQSLIEFTRACNPRYRPAPHHRLIAEHLEAVERGETKRLMIFMPPRHGKSELASRKFPAWFLGRDPQRQIIAASHSKRYTAQFGRHVRNLVAGPEFAAIFPDVRLSPDSRAATQMNTNRDGIYFGATVEAGISGMGADLLLIDDPIRGHAHADSERKREAVDAWFRSDAYTRLMPSGAIILIQTRWHEDDLAGRLLDRQGRKEEGGDWTVLEMPAISPDPQSPSGVRALWPEWFDLDALDETKRVLGPRAWSALYMQKPQPEEGSFFKREHFQEWEVRPERLNIYGTSDHATKTDGGDYSVHQVWGVDVDGNLYRLATWKGQTDTNEWIQRKLNLIRQYRPIAWFGEAGPIKNAIEPFLNRAMNERKIWCRMEWLPSIQDKITRARGFQAMLSCGKIFFEPGADVSEYLAFPAGRHDDEVDASSLIGRALDMAHPAIVPAGSLPRAKRDRWDRIWDEDRDDMEQWRKKEPWEEL